ncbi:MAG TPA: branched-chain amino acid ABC transporter permease [Solirubrobacteraceae bacterium]|nr:branched-chain amino acid ABC transporter permease [Solirubrobacteraceae bacterium]
MTVEPESPDVGVEQKHDPSVGVDEWVARSSGRREYASGVRGDAQRVFERMGWWPKLAIATAFGAIVPLLLTNDFQLQVGINALLLALLALGLNISVGWAGLLDLGYIAFYGFGAYGFALLSSNQLNPPTGIHFAAYVSLPIIAVGAACLGLIVALPSRRLIGDYLAIITLFFGEAFMEFTNNVAPSKLGGPNGITSIDPIKAFGHQITTNKGYFYFLLILLVLSAAALHLLDTSRTGRAWRAVREDPLAASMMTIPVNRVKLMAFSFGAVVAALAGTVFAAQQINVFPTDFDTPYLILIYAALILGGAGSIGGAIVGGLLLSVMLDGLLRSPTEAGYLFYGVILLTLIVKMRPWRKLIAVLAATAVFGIVVHTIVEAISKSAVAGGPQSTGWIASALHNWVVVPSNPTTAGNIGFVVLLCLCVALRQLKDPLRTVLLVPTLYLAACVWEGVLVAQPSITRQILIGVILIVMMNARPQGLFGARRVEVV